jgi:hypothetical protein
LGSYGKKTKEASGDRALQAYVYRPVHTAQLNVTQSVVCAGTSPRFRLSHFFRKEFRGDNRPRGVECAVVCVVRSRILPHIHRTPHPPPKPSDTETVGGGRRGESFVRVSGADNQKVAQKKLALHSALSCLHCSDNTPKHKQPCRRSRSSSDDGARASSDGHAEAGVAHAGARPRRGNARGADGRGPRPQLPTFFLVVFWIAFFPLFLLATDSMP